MKTPVSKSFVVIVIIIIIIINIIIIITISIVIILVLFVYFFKKEKIRSLTALCFVMFNWFGNEGPFFPTTRATATTTTTTKILYPKTDKIKNLAGVFS